MSTTQDARRPKPPTLQIPRLISAGSTVASERVGQQAARSATASTAKPSGVHVSARAVNRESTRAQPLAKTALAPSTVSLNDGRARPPFKLSFAWNSKTKDAPQGRAQSHSAVRINLPVKASSTTGSSAAAGKQPNEPVITRARPKPDAARPLVSNIATATSKLMFNAGQSTSSTVKKSVPTARTEATGRPAEIQSAARPGAVKPASTGPSQAVTGTPSAPTGPKRERTSRADDQSQAKKPKVAHQDRDLPQVPTEGSPTPKKNELRKFNIVSPDPIIRKNKGIPQHPGVDASRGPSSDVSKAGIARAPPSASRSHSSMTTSFITEAEEKLASLTIDQAAIEHMETEFASQVHQVEAFIEDITREKIPLGNTSMNIHVSVSELLLDLLTDLTALEGGIGLLKLDKIIDANEAEARE